MLDGRPAWCPAVVPPCRRPPRGSLAGMVGQRALRFLGLDGAGRRPLLTPAGGAAYGAVVLLAAALMLGATGWVLAGGPLGLAAPLFAVGVLLSVAQIVWAGRRRRQTT